MRLRWPVAEHLYKRSQFQIHQLLGYRPWYQYIKKSISFSLTADRCTIYIQTYFIPTPNCTNVPIENEKKKEKSQIGIYQANKPNEVISISTNSRCCICLLEFAIFHKAYTYNLLSFWKEILDLIVNLIEKS